MNSVALTNVSFFFFFYFSWYVKYKTIYVYNENISYLNYTNDVKYM